MQVKKSFRYIFKKKLYLRGVIQKRLTIMKDLLRRITIDKNVYNGRPSIRGMRFTVSQMLELVASEMTSEEILNDYSYIEADDIVACLHYASHVLNNRNMLLIEEVI